MKNMSHIDLLKDVIVYEEITDTPPEVNSEDVKAYSQRLGIDLVQNPGLATLVKDWILQPLPRYWFPCLDTRTGHWFYSNTLNGQSTWEHPLEEIHRTLAKEYCNPQINKTFERENPEGESAEQSMELGLGIKDPISGESSVVGSGSRGLLPRLLAPLKRPAKPETPSFSSKPLLSPIVSHGLGSEKILEPEHSSDGLSTFKPSNPIRSLLPNDILFDSNKSRQASAAPINGKLIPPIAVPGISRESTKVPGNDLSSDAKRAADKDKSSFLLAYERSETPPGSPVMKNTASENVLQIDSRVTAVKPASGLSFTERLAAKKASRSKLGIDVDKSATKPSLSAAESRPSPEKKRVQFDLEKEQIMHYTPENSEANKISEKSESSSSDDLFDLLGDPKDLKPLKDTASFISTFEEKRWDVKLTSFGVSSSQESSPVKAASSRTEHSVQIQDIGDDEMVTAFTSEYCPSPLPAKPETREETHNTESAAIFVEESISSVEDANKPCQESTSLHEPVLELDILTNIPAPIIINEEPMDLKPLSQSLPDISSSTTTLSDVPIKPLEETLPDKVETKSTFIDSVCLSPVKQIGAATFTAKLEETKKPVVNYATQSNETESARSAQPLIRKKLSRSISRCDSFENSIASVHSDPVILPNPIASLPLPCSVEATNHDSTDKPTNAVECHKIAQLLSSQPSPILASDSSSSSPVAQPTSKPADVRKISLEEKEAPVTGEKAALTPAPDASRDEWLRMRQEMESVLESEKARLENWFKEEIAQIKCQFEKELASEREKTECLSKLVESAQSEKEEAAKLELMRMQETLAKLVEEKTLEVQRRLNSEFLQTASVQKLPAPRTDANVQTDERTPPVEKSTSTDPLKLVSDIDSSQRAPQSHRETQVSPLPRQDSWIKCQCDNLQKQVARVEREMQLLKQKNLSFQKSTPVRKKSAPVKAQRESWWVDSDESTTSSTSHSYAELRPLRHRRSRSLSNLHGERSSHSSRKSKTNERSRDFLSRSQSRRRSQWLEDISPDQSTDTLTSGVSSTLSAGGEWDSVLSSLHKITDDIHEAWSHIGRRQRPLSCLPSQRFADSLMWTSTSTPIYQGNRVPLHWSLSGSTAERTQALKLWLQQNNSHHSQLLCKSDQL